MMLNLNFGCSLLMVIMFVVFSISIKMGEMNEIDVIDDMEMNM